MIGAILFRISADSRNSPSWTIRFNYSLVSADGAKGFVRRTRVWTFSAPSADGFAPERFGTSETRGVMGGVANDRLRSFSEDVERAIGTATTACALELLDLDWSIRGRPFHGEDNTPLSILILGPALPKSVGRIASLRPSASTQIVWLTPAADPAFHSGISGPSAFVPTLRRGETHTWSADVEESLVRTAIAGVEQEAEGWVAQTLTQPASARRDYGHLATDWGWVSLVKDAAAPRTAEAPARAPVAFWLALWQLDDPPHDSSLRIAPDDRPLGGRQWRPVGPASSLPGDINGTIYRLEGYA